MTVKTLKTQHAATFITHSAEETRRVGAEFATLLEAGDAVLLIGDLGAGKTQFSQGVAGGLGVKELPVSPTFSVVMSYDSGRLALHHFDLYRLETREQLETIGFEEYFESGAVCLVEWAEKFPGVFDGQYRVEFEKFDEQTRRITIAEVREEPAREADSVQGSASKISSLKAKDTSVCHEASCGSEVPVYATSFSDAPCVLAFDSANETIAIALGELVREGEGDGGGDGDGDGDNARTSSAPCCVRMLASKEIAARRASNTLLISEIDKLLDQAGIQRQQIACVCVGRGPGSFTGVRICIAAAKGMAQALGVGLVGVSTLDAIAWKARKSHITGELIVVADAMRQEVYPVRYKLDEQGAHRLSADRIVKACDYAKECAEKSSEKPLMIGDALRKYQTLLEAHAQILSESLWEVSGEGLLLAFEAAWRSGECDPFDAARHNPASVLPVYMRLSDAEENERIKLANPGEKNLRLGVQDLSSDEPPASASLHAQSKRYVPENDEGVSFEPMALSHVEQIVRLEKHLMGSDAWNADMLARELGQHERLWWVAARDGEVIAYAGGLVVDAQLQLLKIAVATQERRRGLARELFSLLSEDAKNLAAQKCLLEVRAGNTEAQAFYGALGFCQTGVRLRYYSDGEDALLFEGELLERDKDVAGMSLVHLHTHAFDQDVRKHGKHNEAVQSLAGEASDATTCDKKSPLILAIESSCDETAAAVIDGEGVLLSDVVASQVDYHARFGGVVPEIASRKHIEAICGVCEAALETAHITWSDLDSVAATYAPGLLGALVVGMSFAKGAAWAQALPFIMVNHLEGHLYANKLAFHEVSGKRESFEPPALVSLVSGGNTLLVHMKDWGDYKVLGETIDDAVGEAFDKVAKALGLGYPGGPAISRLAKQGDPGAIDFPRAMLHSGDFKFSLSGLKTAVMNYINREQAAHRELNLANIAASFEQAIIDVQVAKAEEALEQTGVSRFCLGGGVAANPALRRAYEHMCSERGIDLYMPPLASCGDNAGMIALVALDRYRDKKFAPLNSDAAARASLDDPY